MHCLAYILSCAMVFSLVRGMTLFEAIADNHLDNVRELIRADWRLLNDKTGGPTGQTPVMYAVLAGNKEAVEILMDSGADDTIGDDNGYTPMHGAAFQGRAEIARMLIHKYGLDPSDMHADGFRPLHRACWGDDERHTDTVRVLLEAGVRYDEYSSEGHLCMDQTYREGTAKLLVEWKAKDLGVDVDVDAAAAAVGAGLGESSGGEHREL